MAYDGPEIFLAPYGNDAAHENFTRTVERGVSKEEITTYSDFEIDTEPVRLWGTKETVEGTWSNISDGDFLFFYRNGAYQWATEVIGTEENEALGKHIANKAEAVCEELPTDLGNIPSGQVAVDAVHEGGVVPHLGRHRPEQVSYPLLMLHVHVKISDHDDIAFGADTLPAARELARLHVAFHDVDAVLLVEGNA